MIVWGGRPGFCRLWSSTAGLCPRTASGGNHRWVMAKPPSLPLTLRGTRPLIIVPHLNIALRGSPLSTSKIHIRGPAFEASHHHLPLAVTFPKPFLHGGPNSQEVVAPLPRAWALSQSVARKGEAFPYSMPLAAGGSGRRAATGSPGLGRGPPVAWPRERLAGLYLTGGS